MRVQPDAAELFRLPAGIDLSVEEVGHCVVVEPDRGGMALLPHEAHVLDQQQIVGGREAEATDLGVTGIPQKQQFRPRIRSEPQQRALRLEPSC